MRTGRLDLRHLTIDDVGKLVELNADDGVMQYLAWEPPTREQIVHEVSDLITAAEANPGHGRFIAEGADGRFVGWFSLTVGAAGPAAPELGYRLRREAWGRGLATEGSRALIDHAFINLGAESVTAQTMFVNTASRRVMEKSGMRHAKTFHVHVDDPLPGTEHGEVWYEITRDEWLTASMRR
ncbi:GNAT family N-acetyltransferase [Phytoactinopolyspora halotolerans]|uniref:GNAT family N-acetyltransferase n=2 Tax=Phytoactinopolyspora halotolerans TaxID=1981512 RepID=A0A6L9S8Z2_9ACTN|nr:GNAT family N-acetyltransferase [Phytoactinopolyspora halotolerans]